VIWKDRVTCSRLCTRYCPQAGNLEYIKTEWETTRQQTTAGHKRQIPHCCKKDKQCYEILKKKKKVLECNA